MELSSTEPIHGSPLTCPSQGPENVPEILQSLYFLLFKTLVTKKGLHLLKLDTNHPVIVKEKSYWNIILKKTMKMFQPKKKEKDWVGRQWLGGLECRSPREPEKGKAWCLCPVKLFEAVPDPAVSDHSRLYSYSAFSTNCPFPIMPLFSVMGWVPFRILI